jgi:transcription initiation factor TFIID subunit TAF12
LIKEESTSELLRFTIRHILKQVNNQPEYLVLKQQDQQQQKQVQNYQQQQQLHSQVILPSTTSTPVSHQHQIPSVSHTNNLVGHKMTSWKLSSLLSTQTNHHNTLWW